MDVHVLKWSSLFADRQVRSSVLPECIEECNGRFFGSFSKFALDTQQQSDETTNHWLYVLHRRLMLQHWHSHRDRWQTLIFKFQRSLVTVYCHDCTVDVQP